MICSSEELFFRSNLLQMVDWTVGARDKFTIALAFD